MLFVEINASFYGFLLRCIHYPSHLRNSSGARTSFLIRLILKALQCHRILAEQLYVRVNKFWSSSFEWTYLHSSLVQNYWSGFLHFATLLLGLHEIHLSHRAAAATAHPERENLIKGFSSIICREKLGCFVGLHLTTYKNTEHCVVLHSSSDMEA